MSDAQLPGTPGSFFTAYRFWAVLTFGLCSQ